MTTRINRRAVLAGGLAVTGAVIGAKSDRSASLRSNLSQVTLRSASREPLYIAMMDKHVQRLAPLIPELEVALDRRLEIDSLSAEQLYASFTIDLLQQTGRYDVVSLCDAWIPYFGRRGYLTDVPEVEPDSLAIYPTRLVAAALGLDGTHLVAYPWTFDFTCMAWNTTSIEQLEVDAWTNTFRSINASPGLRVGVGLQVPTSAAEVYRSILLSFGSDLVADETHEPTLGLYGARRALSTAIRLSRLDPSGQSLQMSQDSLASRSANGDWDLAASIWSSDSSELWASEAWSIGLIPSGRPGVGVTNTLVWLLGVPAGAPNRDEARAFVRLMTSTGFQTKLWSATGLAPARRSALNADWSPGGTVARALAFSALDHTRLRPRLRSFRSIMEIAGQLVGETVTAGQVSEAMLAEANQRMLDVVIQEDELNR